MRTAIRMTGVSFAAILVGLATQTYSQTLPQNLTKEDLAKDNNLFLSLARKALKWDEPSDPIKIGGYSFALRPPSVGR